MANTSFDGPVRSKSGFKHYSVQAGTGVETEITIVDSSGTTLETAETGITADTNSDQANAYALTKNWNNITVCATDGHAVALPTAAVGLRVTVKNSGNTSLAVFPKNGATDQINALADDLSVNIAPGGQLTFRGIAAGANGIWETNEVLVLPAPTTLRGEFIVKATDNDTDTVTTLTNAAMDQASVISIPDPGASTANVLLTSQANDTDLVTATALELNFLDMTPGTGAASKAVVLSSGDDFTWPDTGVLTIGNYATAAESTEHGAGAIGGGATPTTYRWIENGVIITQIKFDITDFLVKGDAANDVIGITGGGDAYIGQYTIAANGVVFKAELTCLETPTEATSTITQDIDIGPDASSTLAYDEAADGDRLINAGSLTVGETVVNLTPGAASGLTANDYLYVVEGDTAAATGKYSGGMFILTMWGHALLS